jgi:hypothetical protein
MQPFCSLAKLFNSRCTAQVSSAYKLDKLLCVRARKSAAVPPLCDADWGAHAAYRRPKVLVLAQINVSRSPLITFGFLLGGDRKLHGIKLQARLCGFFRRTMSGSV